MPTQQLIAQTDNILAVAEATASAVSPSTAIRSLGMSRQGTGLVTLSGSYTGHESADYDVEIVAAEGTGRASAPKFTGVGSGSLTVTQANIPAQEVSLTLVTPPFPGSPAELLVGTDALRAVPVGMDGNRVRIDVDASALSLAPSGASTLEEVAEGQEELTGWLWDIAGVITSTDLSGNVPSNAPRLKFGGDPQVYRVVRDFRGGSARTLLTPAAVRAIPKGTPIILVTGSYAVTLTGEGLGMAGVDLVEIYPASGAIVTGYDLVSALALSDLLRPAYTPAPVTTPGGNARTDLPVVTGAYALISEASKPNIRPADLSARADATAQTITFECRGNGSWTVTGTASGSLPAAREGERYAPADSPVLLTIPARPVPEGIDGIEPVSITQVSLAGGREEGDALPNICIEGVLGANASPRTITATYAKRTDPDDCPCSDVAAPWWNEDCLGLDLLNSEGGENVDEAYQTRLIDLFEWQKDFIGGNAVILTYEGTSSTTQVVEYEYCEDWTAWQTTGYKFDDNAEASTIRGELWLGTVTRTQANELDLATQVLRAAYPSATGGQLAGVTEVVYGTSGGASASANSNDIALCKAITAIFAHCLSKIWASVTGLAAWDSEFSTMQTEISALSGTSDKLDINYHSSMVAKYEAAANYCLACAGIVPGKSSPVSGSVTGCWQDIDGEYWWVLSDGYAPAFTNEEYYSTLAGSFANTREFAFQIRCACENRLKEGDSITISIGANLANLVWGSSEKLSIDVVPSNPLYAVGGMNADDTETWNVAAKDGSGVTLPAVTLSASNRSYSSGGLAFDLPAGGIPFALGDKFTFTIEGGTFRWRRDSGAWSTAAAIADGTSLERGLTVSFLSGSAPSFTAGDMHQFRVLQDTAPAKVLTPDACAWQWATGAATITLTWTGDADISTLAIVHELPSTATVTAEITADGKNWTALAWLTGVTLRSHLHVAAGTSVEAVGLRLTFSQPGAVRWIWAGEPFQPDVNAALRLRHVYDTVRAKVAGAAALLAEGTAASLEWDMLSLSDAGRLAAMVRGQKLLGDAPLILIPHGLHLTEAYLCRIDGDEFEINDEFNYEPDNTAHRSLSASLELVPEWRAVA
ncbi:MAG: hypothetical protein PHG20_00210 [Geobacteraceae bacterium]|nr:hypothetical protein [Geobacteraceae bacterium]